MGQRIVGFFALFVIAIMTIRIVTNPQTPKLLNALGDFLAVGFAAELGKTPKQQRGHG